MQQGDSKEQLEQGRRRRGHLKYNKQAPRYECFCGKQYLSYPALYLHLKNKHSAYFLSTKGGKKVEATKLVETFDSNEGFKVFRIPQEAAAGMADGDRPSVKGLDNGYEQEGQQLFFPPPAFLPYPYQHYPFEYMGREELQHYIPNSNPPLERLLSQFLEKAPRVSSKQRTELELLLILLVECVNKNYQLIKDEKAAGKEVRRYSAQYSGENIERVFQCFETYLEDLKKEEGKPYSFFLKHSSIITGQGYRKVLRDVHRFMKGGQDLSESGSEGRAEEGEEANSHN